MTNKLVVFINSLKVPKIKKSLLYEMKFLVPIFSCLQNPWLGATAPISPLFSALCPHLNLLNLPRTKFLDTPLERKILRTAAVTTVVVCWVGVWQGIVLYVFTSVLNYLLTTSSLCYASVLNNQGASFSDTLVIPAKDGRRRIFGVHHSAVDILILLGDFAVLVYSWLLNYRSDLQGLKSP